MRTVRARDTIALRRDHPECHLDESRTCPGCKLESLARDEPAPRLQPSRAAGDPAEKRLLACFHPTEHGRRISIGHAAAKSAATATARAHSACEAAQAGNRSARYLYAR